jgi:NAD(P)-dependent dehydrogenase (short-subunit alcohol dehydrogenase family)
VGRFDGEVAVITGGSSGIGLASAQALAAEGAHVFLAARDAERGASAAESIQAQAGQQGEDGQRGQATFVQTDVTDDSQVARLASTAAGVSGRIDIWFNNAAYEGVVGPIGLSDDAIVQQLVDTNVKGVFSGMRYAAEHMPEGGVILNNASFVGVYIPIPVGVPYGGTKAAVISMSRAAALALQEQGIDVFAICPGIVDTPMLDRLTGGQGIEARRGFAAQMAPSGQLMTAAEVAGAVVDLCSRTSGYKSGDALLIDAGPTVKTI